MSLNHKVTLYIGIKIDDGDFFDYHTGTIIHNGCEMSYNEYFQEHSNLDISLPVLREEDYPIFVGYKVCECQNDGVTVDVFDRTLNKKDIEWFTRKVERQLEKEEFEKLSRKSIDIHFRSLQV